MTPSDLQTPEEAPSDAATAEEATAEVADAAAPGTSDVLAPVTGRKPRASRRIPKSDAVLEAAVERARQGILEIAPESQIGRHVSAVVEGERLVTHRFEAFLPGYGGWQWYASLARVPRGKEASVCEVGLLPSETSLRAPDWVPWSERVRPEDHEQEDGAAATAPAPAAAPVPETGAGPGTTGDDAEQPDAP
ncbi:DUF3027 domain-containing protein [Arthrobacter echini]|uniref:DUF3027 domain-containing protein n=1 Tax=Arthrobacter echini TaxID=1529066 RepID=A0A4S5E590_9MICC|nr:DUF3027 domain-containing protein [Arthrobacter echini]THJ66685.1 DUF3027 domain-containing protein [Arthrobacter echini]